MFDKATLETAIRAAMERRESIGFWFVDGTAERALGAASLQTNQEAVMDAIQSELIDGERLWPESASG